MRGNDIPNIPVFNSYAIISKVSINLYGNLTQFSADEIAAHLNPIGNLQDKYL